MEQAFFHVTVGAESEKLDLPFSLGFFRPGSGTFVELIDAAYSMDEVKINVIRLHSLE